MEAEKPHVLPLLARKVTKNLNDLPVAIAKAIDLRKQIFPADQIAAPFCKIFPKAENGVLL